MGDFHMTQATALVIRALGAGHRWGFDIMDATGLSSGTVYPTLRRLERAGLVTARWEDRAAASREGRPRRRMFELTGEGRKAAVEADRMLARAAARLADLLGGGLPDPDAADGA